MITADPAGTHSHKVIVCDANEIDPTHYVDPIGRAVVRPETTL
jgi:hypothetical protein